MRFSRIDHSGKGSSVGRASAFQADCRGFEPRPLLHGPVAQWIKSSRFLPCRSQVRILPGSPFWKRQRRTKNADWRIYGIVMFVGFFPLVARRREKISSP